MTDEPAVILFDGECNLCNRAVDLVLRRDREGRYRFAALQSPAAARICAGVPPTGETLHLIDAAGHHVRSTAVLRIAAGLGRPWSWLRVLQIVPPGIRDRFYDFIARRRSRWFGRRSACRVPSAAERNRFLD